MANRDYRDDYRHGSVIIEDKAREGLSPLESVGLIMVGAAIMGLAFALALAIVELSLALSVSVVAIGIGFGGSLGAKGVAEIVLAWGRARALVTREVVRAEVEKARAEMERARAERARLEWERARLEGAARRSLPAEEHSLAPRGPEAREWRVIGGNGRERAGHLDM